MLAAVYRFLSASLIMTCAYVLPFTKIWGSWLSYFSWSSIAAPIISHHFGFFSFFSILLAKLLFHPERIALFLLLKRLPLIFSSWAFAGKNWITHLLIPALCMILFLAHPVGGKVFYYSFYWLIPMALYFVPASIFSQALASTFIAHATGSIVWLYGKNVGVEVWQLLVPMVICERLLMAAGIVALHYFVVAAGSLCKAAIIQFKACRKSA
jgi:hypothetical protein